MLLSRLSFDSSATAPEIPCKRPTSYSGWLNETTVMLMCLWADNTVLTKKTTTATVLKVGRNNTVCVGGSIFLLCPNKLNKLSLFPWLNKQSTTQLRTDVLCLCLADPATLLASNNAPGPYSTLRTACLFRYGQNKYFWVCLSLLMLFWVQISFRKLHSAPLREKTWLLEWGFSQSLRKRVKVILFVIVKDE